MKSPNFNRRRFLKERRKNIVLVLKRILKATPIVAGIIIIFMFLFLYLSLNRRFVFSKSSNMAFVYPERVRIVNYDPKFKEMLVLDIDGNIILDTSSNKGKYPLKNVFDLSINEKTQTALFRKTLMKNFHIPIQSAIDCRSQKYSKSMSLISLLSCKKSKNFSDLVYAMYLRWSAGNNITYKDLSDYDVLLKDADVGGFYLDDSKIFNKLEFDFSTDMDIKDVINVEISSDAAKIPLYLDEIVKISGGRVVNSSPGEEVNLSDGCEIEGSNFIFNKYIKAIFGCRTYLDREAEVSKIRFSKVFLESYF